MTNLDPVVFRELPVIQKIIADETWLEGERRGTFVSSEDPVVQGNVCEIILCIGENLRQMFQGRDTAQTCPIPISDHSHAA